VDAQVRIGSGRIQVHMRARTPGVDPAQQQPHHARHQGSSEQSDSRDNDKQPGQLSRGHPSPPRPDEAQEAAGGTEEEGGYDPRDGIAAEEEEAGGEVGQLPSLVELQDCRFHHWGNLNLFTFTNILKYCMHRKHAGHVVVRSGHIFIYWSGSGMHCTMG